MPWPQIGATQYHAQLGFPDKGRAIKGFVVCNDWDLEPLNLLNGLALECYQSSPEALIVYNIYIRISKIRFLLILGGKTKRYTIFDLENKGTHILPKCFNLDKQRKEMLQRKGNYMFLYHICISL